MGPIHLVMLQIDVGSADAVCITKEYKYCGTCTLLLCLLKALYLVTCGAWWLSSLQLSTACM